MTTHEPDPRDTRLWPDTERWMASLFIEGQSYPVNLRAPDLTSALFAGLADAAEAEAVLVYDRTNQVHIAWRTP